MIAKVFLVAMGVYLACGFLFAVAFALFGARHLDPHARQGTWGFRILIIPGAAALWPLLAGRWLRGIHEPPEQCDAHRRAANGGCRSQHVESPTETKKGTA